MRNYVCRIVFGVHLAALFLVISAENAWSDGIVLPPAVSTRLVDMPVQRGMVIHSDGIEKLIVESSFDGDGRELAWIVPIPTEPVSINETVSGIFTTLELALQPRVVDGSFRWVVVPIVLVVVLTCLLITFSGFNAAFWVSALLIFFFWVVWPGILLVPYSLLGSLGNDLPPACGVRVLQAATAGSYDIRTLKPNSPEALNAWLRDNGFQSIPDEGTDRLQDYIRRGWCFVAAKLTRSEDRLTRPHPLAITFPTDRPVYPMRLTQLASRALELDLYVVANTEVSVPGLNRTYSNYFTKSPTDRLFEPTYAWFGRRFEGDPLGTRFHLPAFEGLLPSQFALTRLQGTITPYNLIGDLYPEPKHVNQYRQKKFTPRAVHSAAIYLGIFAGVVVLFILCGRYYLKDESRRTSSDQVLAVTVSLAAGVAVALALHAGLPRAHSHYSMDKMTFGEEAGLAARLIDENREYLSGKSKGEVEVFFADRLGHHVNPFTGQSICFDEAPGSISIVEKDDGLYLRSVSADIYGVAVGQCSDRLIATKAP